MLEVMFFSVAFCWLICYLQQLLFVLWFYEWSMNEVCVCVCVCVCVKDLFFQISVQIFFICFTFSFPYVFVSS